MQALLRARPLLGSTLAVAAITGFAKVNGGLREVLVANDFGTSRRLEAFLVGFALVSIGIDALVGAIPSALIPTIHRRGPSSSQRPAQVLGAILPRLALIGVGISALVALGAPAISLAVAGGFDEASRRLVADVIVILAPTVALGLLTAVVTSSLQADERFSLAALPSVANPLATILVVVRSTEPRATTLAWAFCAGYAAELVAALVLAVGTGVRVARPSPAAATHDRRLFFRQLVPLSMAFLVLSAMTLTDQSVATHLGRGQVAILSFGIKIPGFVAAVGMTAVGAIVLPQFSRLVAGRQVSALRESVRVKARLILVVSLVVSLAMAIGSRPVIEAVFSRGQFTRADAASAASVQVIAAWQLPSQLLAVMYARLLSARHRNRAIFGVSAVAAIANLVLDIVLGGLWGARGVALSTTVVLAAMCGAFALLARATVFDQVGSSS